MGIAEDDIQKVRSSVTLSDVVSPYSQLRRTGRSQVGLCPFHSERSPSFSVNDETGRYMCFGCGAKGDVFTFVQQMEHLDFVGSVERIASKAGIELRYTSGAGNGERKHRKELQALMERAVDWYHTRLLESPDARAAREYLRDRGLAGDVARSFRLGWAPDEWDALSTSLGATPAMLAEVGLGFVNKAGRLQDSFRARVMFPIFDENGAAVAFGGRILPGSTDPAKYKNSTETPVYIKSRTLYGMNWAKGNVVKEDRVIVCEGYTDVIGFHRSGLATAVATCGTALTEDHVKLMKRYARNVVLAFDADAAGQGATDKFYAWEKKYDISVSVAQFPAGKDPGELASSDPDALTRAINDAMPFLGFRLKRLFDANPLRSPESRARLAGKAMELVNEHPDSNVRRLYAGQVASHTGVSAADLVKVADRGGSAPVVIAAPVQQATEGAGFVALSLLIHEWDTIAPWLIEELFPDDASRDAFRAIAAADGDVHVALQSVAPDAADIIERAAVYDIDADALVESRALISAAVRRELSRRRLGSDIEQIQNDRMVRNALEDLNKHDKAQTAAVILLQWLAQVAQAAT
ncbi:MAG: DNA primase [Ilumatobacteraceae bacterium]|jgi:DNA primase|nr:DNA primase [Ilumatobacteraceae bacterium]MDP5068651.1 DNA primase [Ilumatobacteraceae bacterium]